MSITVDPMLCTVCGEPVGFFDAFGSHIICCGCYEVFESDIEEGRVDYPKFWRPTDGIEGGNDEPGRD